VSANECPHGFDRYEYRCINCVADGTDQTPSRSLWLAARLRRDAEIAHEIADSEPDLDRASVLRRAACEVSVIAERVRG
jgi:hypothetical protein